jgi:arginyl-tRNA synthetase
MTAEKLGISAIKYFDLKQNRIQNYVFSFDKMLDPKGNTGVYLLYMFVRIVSIMQKSEYGKEDILAKLKNEHAGFVISNKSEKELALAILRLPE